MKRIITSALFLFAVLNMQAQYMSFFGDSTWEYHITYLTNTPEDYITEPPEIPNPLNVYCRTFSVRFDKSVFDDSTHHYRSLSVDGVSLPNLLRWSRLFEDTVNGRLYVDTRGWGNEPFRSILVCDMSLSEGDTFVLGDPGFYPNPAMPPHWDYDTIGDRHMIVDSVRYIDGRKNIFLSLIDHQDDYFFGTDYSSQLSDYKFTVRFIEGIGASYGLLPGRRYPSSASFSDLYPSMGLLLCMSKDESMVYMADTTLGCDQTCVGVEEHSPLVATVYPNPTDNLLHIELSGADIANVALYDLQGRVVGANNDSSLHGTTATMNLRHIPAGVYVLRVTDADGKEYHQKIVKR